MVVAEFYGFEFKVYELVFAAILALLLLIGFCSAFHLKRFNGRAKRLLTEGERNLLKLPGLWLTSSMWLNYLGNAVVALSVACSVAVVVMTAFEDDADVIRVILYTLISLAGSLLVNYTHSKEKSEGYREAANYFRPICEQFESRYTQYWDVYDLKTREKDLAALIKARAEAEEIICRTHSYNYEGRHASFPSL